MMMPTYFSLLTARRIHIHIVITVTVPASTLHGGTLNDEGHLTLSGPLDGPVQIFVSPDPGSRLQGQGNISLQSSNLRLP